MHGRLLVATGLFLAVSGIALSAGSAYAYFWDRARADVIADGVSVAGIDVGGMPATDAEAVLEARFGEYLRRPVHIVGEGHAFTLRPAGAGLRVDVAHMVDDAVSLTRRGGLAHRLARDLRTEPLRRTIPLRAALSGEHVTTVVSRIARVIDRPAKNAEVVPKPLALGLKVEPERIGVGQAGLETPSGLYEINDKQVNPSWHVPLSSWAGSLAGQVIPPGPSNPIKARWLGFFNGAGIHGTVEDWSIGTAASHGCIRMHIWDVEDLYDRVPLHSPIYVG